MQNPGWMAALSVAAAVSAALPATAQRTVDVPSDDAAMAAAQAKARASLDTFWTTMAAPPPGVGGFSLKVGFPVGEGRTEHIWVQNVERKADGGFAGILANAPRNIEGKRAGDRVEFSDQQISDWTFRRNGKIVGNETMRPLLERMPKQEADYYRAMLEKP